MIIGSHRVCLLYFWREYFIIEPLFMSILFCENEKDNFCKFLYTSPMVSMIRWFLYLTMSFKIGSLMLFAIGS